MPDRRRSAMALMMAASIFALPTSLLAAQDEQEPKPENRNTLREAHERRMNAAPNGRTQFFVAGPSRYAFTSGYRMATNPAKARQYTEEELREIRAAQIRLIRNMGAGPGSTPGGTAVLSHPTLGRITISSSGPIVPDPKGGTIAKPNHGLLAGPSPTGGGGSSEPKSGSGGGGEPGDFQVLVPGPGFRGPTAQPGAKGDPSQAGYDAKAIARWDVVPHQAFDGIFEIGVVAFHMSGIEKVAFSVDGGDWVTVDEMTLNPRTQVEEYWVGLDASLFAEDKPVEVRAIVYPNVGVPRVLAGDMDWENSYQGPQWTGEHSMYLVANGGGTSDELVVELPEGTYEWGDLPGVPREIPEGRWLVIQPEPGARVELLPGRWNHAPDFIRLSNLDLVQPTRWGHLGGSSNTVIWFDSVSYTGPGTWEESVCIRVKHQFWTDSSVTDAKWGQAAHFIRNSRFERIGEDTFGSTYLLANTTVRNPDPRPAHLDWHPAVISNPLNHDNRVYLNLDIEAAGKAWAFRNGTWDYWEHTDVAIVGCRTTKTSAGNQMLYLGGQVNHMVIKDCVWRGHASWNYRLSDSLSVPEWQFDPHNVVLMNNDWFNDSSWLPEPPVLEGVTIIPIDGYPPAGG